MTSLDLKGLLKNKTQGTKYMTTHLKQKPLNQQFSSEDDPLIAELLTWHPDHKAGGIGDLEYCVMRPNATYYTPTLHFKRADADEEDTISYKVCVENLFGKYDRTKYGVADRTRAFRLATYDDFHRDFYSANTNPDGTATCSNPGCGRLCGGGLPLKSHVDHYQTSFKQILADFLAAESIQLCDVAIMWRGIDALLADGSLEERWICYHNGRAQYRILCGPCNSKFGDYSDSESHSQE
jgi:hypothetical protein